MPIFNPADIPSHKGWSKRQAAALAIAAEREAERNDPSRLAVAEIRRQFMVVHAAKCPSGNSLKD